MRPELGPGRSNPQRPAERTSTPAAAPPRITRGPEATEGGAPGEADPAAAGADPAPSALAGEDLAAALRAGDPVALQRVVEAYLPQILRAARGAGLPPEAAEEVTQETFATFLEVVSRFEGRSHVRTFLFGILYRKISEARRGFVRERRHDPIDEVMESRFAADGSWSRPPAPADTLVRRNEVRQELAECLEASPTAQRMAFYLREVEGLARQEICKILGISSTNLDVMLYRLRNRTRECLEAKKAGASR